MIILILYFIGCVVSFIMIKEDNKKRPYSRTLGISTAITYSTFSWCFVAYILFNGSNLHKQFNKWCDDFEKGNGK